MSILPPDSTHSLVPAWDVALLFPPQGQWSVDEYLSLTEGANHLVEYTSGNIEVLEMPTLAHQRILRYLFVLLSKFVDRRQLGEVFFAALPVQLTEQMYREPDVIFVGHSRRAAPQDLYLKHADLVMEIVSDDSKSRKRDLVTKRMDYATSGIPEYWIVDPVKKRITVLALEGLDYVTVGESSPGEQAISRLLEGFSVDVAMVFQAAEGGVSDSRGSLD